MSSSPKRTLSSQPIALEGYAVFVRLWNITPAVDLAAAIVEHLDEHLLALAKADENRYFPSPYGGAILFETLQAALDAGAILISAMSAKGIEISISITHGLFQRLFNVSRWNVASLALNMAARMASDPNVRKRVVVDEKVHHDAMQLGVRFCNNFFDEPQKGKVKRTEFIYYRVCADPYVQAGDLTLSVTPVERDLSTVSIVAFDIEKYSEKSQAQQQDLATRLSTCVEHALSSLGSPFQFGPAGDGGFLAFDPHGASSAPRAWSFARELSRQAKVQAIPLRVGIANGLVQQTSYRELAGGAVLDADYVSGLASVGDIAVTASIASLLVEDFRTDWRAFPTSDPSVFVLRTTTLVHYFLTTAVNSSLFLLSRSIPGVFCVGTFSLLGWWFLSDFYMSQHASWWTEWMDRYGFIGVSLLFTFLLGLAAAVYVLRLNFRNVKRNWPFSIDSSMRVTIAAHKTQSSVSQSAKNMRRAYDEWLSRRISSAGPLHIGERESYARAWWFSRGSVLPVLLASLWLPVLCACFILAPIYTNVLELLASRWNAYPNRIFACLNRVQVPRKGHADVIEEDLGRNNNDGSWFRLKTALSGQGTLTVRATDFPRVYRRIIVECAGAAPNCAILGSRSDPDLEIPLRSGAATFSFIQTSSELGLNMRVLFVSKQNVTFETILIEPR